MKFLAIIPSRYASTRFPGKPLAEIGGKPMVQHVYERVSQYFAEYWVATDDTRIEQAVENFGGRVVMTSAAHRSGTDRCAEALSEIERSTGCRFDVVVNIQGDEPFIAEEHLVKIKDAFTDNDVQIATLVKPFGEGEEITNPNTPKVVVSASGDALYFSRSVIPYLRNVEPGEWQKTHKYLKHIGVYAWRADVLRAVTRLPQGVLELAESLEQLRWLENGYRIKTVEVTTETVAVDTPEDLERVAALMSRKF